MDWGLTLQTMLLGTWAIGAYKLVTLDTAEVAERITKVLATRKPREVRAARLPVVNERALAEQALYAELHELFLARQKAIKNHAGNLAGGYMGLARDSKKGVDAIEAQIHTCADKLEKLRRKKIDPSY